VTPERKAYLLGLTQYPQFTVNESIIARAWLVKHADEWDDVLFNVSLGSHQVLGPGYSEATQRQAAAITTKRADMVATSGEFVAIVECKVRVALTAMGQLLGYEVLWRAEHPETLDVKLIAIGNSALIDVVDVLMAHHIQVELFPDVTLHYTPPS
jgi:hypothetical protein